MVDFIDNKGLHSGGLIKKAQPNGEKSNLQTLSSIGVEKRGGGQTV